MSKTYTNTHTLLVYLKGKIPEECRQKVKKAILKLAREEKGTGDCER